MKSERTPRRRSLLFAWGALLLAACSTSGAAGGNQATIGNASAARERLDIPDNAILHVGHSANLLKIGDRVLVFDYPFGSRANEDILYPLDPNQLADERVYVIASHRHGDHFNSRILTWSEQIARIRYILSSDISRRPDDAVVLAPGQVVNVEGMQIRAYRSTDAGVAFSIYVEGKHIYFSGDNGFWNQKADKSEQDYLIEALAAVDTTTPVDIAFQVCDPRFDGLGDGGVGVFARTFQPKLLVPLHTRGDYEFPKKVAGRLHEQGYKGRFWAPKGLGDTTALDPLATGAPTESKTAASLHEAAAAGDIERIQSLLAANGNVNADNADQRSALHLAAAFGRPDASKLLISKGATVDAKDKLGRTPLHLAAGANAKAVAELLVASGADVNVADQRQRTPLHEAVFSGAEDVVKILLDAGAATTAKADGYLRTPLHAAAMIGHLPLAQLLIERGADVEAEDRLGVRPLHLAADEGQRDLAVLLLNTGVQINATSRSGRTALHLAVGGAHFRLVRLLIAEGAEVNLKDRYGYTPLKTATVSKYSDIAAYLRKHGATE